VDLLRVVDHSRTNSFFNTMTAHNLLPTITRPTRITSYSASLIDNIFLQIYGPRLLNLRSLPRIYLTTFLF